MIAIVDLPSLVIEATSTAKVEKVVSPPANPVPRICRWLLVLVGDVTTARSAQPTMFTVKVDHGNDAL